MICQALVVAIEDKIVNKQNIIPALILLGETHINQIHYPVVDGLQKWAQF